MSNLWIPRDFRDPDKVTENLPGKPLAIGWGGTGIAAADLASLKNYLGISASDEARVSRVPLRRLQATDPTAAAGFDVFGLPAPTVATPGGALSHVSVAAGSFVRLIDDSSTPLPAELSISRAVQRRWDPDIVFTFRPQVAVTGTVGRLWVGLTNDLNLSSYDTLAGIVGVGRVAAFRFHGSLDAAAGGTFSCMTADNTSDQRVQGTVSFINDGANSVRIRYAGASTWEFSVYDYTAGEWVVEAQIVATIAASDTMYPYIAIERTAAIAGNRNLEISSIDLVMS